MSPPSGSVSASPWVSVPWSNPWSWLFSRYEAVSLQLKLVPSLLVYHSFPVWPSLSDSLVVSVVVSESVEPSPETVTPSASVSVLVRLSESVPPQVKLRVPCGRKPPEPIVSEPVTWYVWPPDPAPAEVSVLAWPTPEIPATESLAWSERLEVSVPFSL